MTSEAVGFEHSIGMLGQNTSASTWNPAGVRDPAYDALADAVLLAPTQEELVRRVGEAAMYLTEKHWHVWLGRAPKFAVAQPWVIGYNGEVAQESGVIFARVWIDQDLKREMGF